MKTTKQAVISSEIAKGSQDVIFTKVQQLGDEIVRIQIRSDAYKNQCHAHVSVWKDKEWSFVHSIHYNKMKTKEQLCYGPEAVTEAAFSEDRTELLRVAKEIL